MEILNKHCFQQFINTKQEGKVHVDNSVAIINTLSAVKMSACKKAKMQVVQTS